MDGLNYKKNIDTHLRLLKQLGLHNLNYSLSNFTKNQFSKKVEINDCYHISRIVRPGDRVESFRGHFDSHMFTLVLPILIPNEQDLYNNGELFLMPNIRKRPKNEIVNILQKIYTKSYNSHDSYIKALKKNKGIIENFNNLEPLLFNGDTSFHGNFPNDNSYSRLTLLSHFFDTSSKYGVGSLLRKLRNR